MNLYITMKERVESSWKADYLDPHPILSETRGLSVNL